jgi:hypothetical protein
MQPDPMPAAAECRMPLPEECVTFQIALIGSDGLVVGSDRMVSEMKAYPNDEKFMLDRSQQSKFVKNKGESVVCFCAGGADSQNQARDIARDCHPRGDSDLEWDTQLEQAAKKTRRVIRMDVFNEIIVVRKEIPDAVWLVKSDCQTQTFVSKITDRKCTGSNVVAQFLSTHLWNATRSIPDLKKLALLGLAYAARENPTSIGGSFDLMTLDRQQQFSWSRYESLTGCEKIDRQSGFRSVSHRLRCGAS